MQLKKVIFSAALAISTSIGITHAGPIVDAAKKAEALANEGKAIDAVFAIDAAISRLWDKIGINIVDARFVSERPTGYGAYKPIDKPVYKAGQDILIYAEIIGYRYGKNGDDITINLNVDMEVKTKDGKVLGGQKDFLKLSHAARVPAREFFTVLTYNFGGIPPGEYIVETRLNDQNHDQWAAFELDFTIVK